MSQEIVWRVGDVAVMIDPDSGDMEIGTIVHDQRWNHRGEWDFDPIREIGWDEYHAILKGTKIPDSVVREVYGI